MSLECVACGRALTNDWEQLNQAAWTLDPFNLGGRLPYCADSDDCQRDAYEQLGVTT